MTAARPPFEQAVVEGFWREPPFTEAGVREMFLLIGLGSPPVPDAPFVVAEKLNDLERGFALDRWHEVQPGVSEDEKGARRLALACRDVLRALGLEGNGGSLDGLLPFVGPGGLYGVAAAGGAVKGEDAILDRIRAVDQLRQDSEGLAAILERRRALHRPKVGKPELRALKRLVGGLGQLFRDAWQKEPTVVRNEGQAQGPFVALMVYVVEAIHSRLGSGGIQFTAESLAKTWERLRAEEESVLT